MTEYKLKTSRIVRLRSYILSLRFVWLPLRKRIMDYLLASIALILLSPLMTMVAVLIKLDSKGPVFFKQQRVGHNGICFNMWKFRSMSVDAETRKEELLAENEMDNGVLFKMKKDPRITRVGRIIRKTSIDELPQLFNILLGEMSLVGPRPPLPNEVAEYRRSDYQRLDALPGITCKWQVSGRSDIPFEQQVEMDIDYIEHQSLWNDIVLLMKTIPAVIFARGAY